MTIQAYRLPLALMVLCINGVVQGFLQSSIFNGVADFKMSWRDTEHNHKTIMNVLGLAYLAASDQFIMMSMAQVLTIPAIRPTFEREVGNRMYSPGAFYMALTFSGLTVFFLYPLFTALISFWSFGFTDPTWMDFWNWTLPMALMAWVGSIWGFSFGSFFSNEMIALQWNLVCIILFNLGAGQQRSIGSSTNYFASFISKVSPIRYGTEMLMSRLMEGNMAKGGVMASLGYTNGEEYNRWALVCLCLFFFVVGWINLMRTNSRD